MKKTLKLIISSLVILMPVSTILAIEENYTVALENTKETTSSESSLNTTANHHFYINGDIGYGHINISHLKPILGIKVKEDNSFIGSFNIGYQFNQYFALETGYIILPNIKYSGFGTVQNVPFSFDTKTNLYAITLALKGIYPFNNRFGLFAKAGLAYENASNSATFVISGMPKGGESSMLTNQSQIAAYFALGMEYTLALNWVTDIQAAVIPSAGHFPVTWMGLIGVSYKFSI